MNIAEILIRPLVIDLKQPYHWAHGARREISVNLIEVTADDGTTGYGWKLLPRPTKSLRLWY